MTSVERPDTTRQRAAEAGARVRYEDMFNDPDDDRWDEVDPAARRYLVDVMDIGLAAAVPVVLDDIEALIQNRARAPKLAKTESLRLFDLICNAVLDEVLGDVAAWRVRNGWSRDSE